MNEQLKAYIEAAWFWRGFPFAFIARATNAWNDEQWPPQRDLAMVNKLPKEAA
jgi:hypothetical protein